MEEKGYFKKEITPRFDLLIKADNNRAVIKIDFLVTLENRICMIIRYGPGSLVTRHRTSLAASRLVAPYQVPVIVVTNGKAADILDGRNGKVVASGLEAIPARMELMQKTAENQFGIITRARAEQESRIIYAFEVDGSCPCDDTICKLSNSATDK